ncbi:carbohydrate-binding module family 14 protein [Streptomyces sp. NPDC048291]|uniref:carbohydrate-binding module family 14 protein n=1 Tax=unclassified Streptomyces TaxID=2593676 RepID=UPI00342988BA
MIPHPSGALRAPPGEDSHDGCPARGLIRKPSESAAVLSVRLRRVLLLTAVAGVLQIVTVPTIAAAYASPCNEQDIEDTNGCRDWPYCTYTNQEDPHSYIQCNADGQASTRTCPPLLVWDDQQKRCDFAS